MWKEIREKFVNIILRKVRLLKISDKQERFYKYFIFLEDYISHKNDPVYKTQNKKRNYANSIR